MQPQQPWAGQTPPQQPPAGQPYPAPGMVMPQPAAPVQPMVNPGQLHPGPVSQYAPAPGQTQAYDFIMNPAKPKRANPLSGTGTLQRVLIGGAGLLIVIILFSVISSAVSKGKSVVPAMTSVLQHQEEIIHLTNGATLAKAGGDNLLDGTNENFVATANLSVSSSVQQNLRYVTANHGKIKPVVLTALLSTKTDERLTAAAQAGTFNETYRDIMQTELKNYELALQRSYQQLHGPKGKALLKDQYAQADLLLKSLQTN